VKEDYFNEGDIELKFKYSFEYVDADLFLLDKRELRYSQRILNIKRISEL